MNIKTTKLYKNNNSILIYAIISLCVLAIIGIVLIAMQSETASITTGKCINASDNYAIVTSNIDVHKKNSISSVGVFYGINPDELSYTAPFTKDYSNSFTITIYGLEPETTYYYQAYTKQTNGDTILGDIRVFTTLPTPRIEIIVQTLPAVNIIRGELEIPAINNLENENNETDNDTPIIEENNWSVTLKGEVSGTNIVELGFYYGTNKKDLTQRIKIDNWYKNMPLEANLDNLTHKVTYYYQAYAFDDTGEEKLGELLYVTMADAQSYDMYADDYVHYESYEEKLKLYCVDGDYNYKFFLNPLKTGAINVEPTWVKNNIAESHLFSDRVFRINKMGLPKFKNVVNDIKTTKVKIIYDDKINEFMLSDLIFTEDGVTSFRYIGGSKSLSNHSFGLAIDLNASIEFNKIKYSSDARANYALLEEITDKLSLENAPLQNGKEVELRYNDFAPTDGLVPDELINYLLYELAFKEQGFYWGGYYKNVHDPMHYDLVTVPSRSGIPLERKDFVE